MNNSQPVNHSHSHYRHHHIRSIRKFKIITESVGLISIILFLLIQSLLTAQAFTIIESSDTNIKNNDWTITFSTGRRMWAGTDSNIYVELIGDKDKSDVIPLTPVKTQLEAKSVDSFNLGDLHGRNIGTLKSIIIAKQYTVGLFSDWELVVAKVFDSNGNIYEFKCNCWLTNQRNKRTLKVTAINGNLNGDVRDGFARTARIFPITIVLLSLFLIMVLFSYFGNILCKKWRQNVQFLNDLRHGRRTVLRNSNNTMGSRFNGSVLNRAENDADNRHNRSRHNQDDLSSINIPLQLTTNEDKPPDYKELFPIENRITEATNRQKPEEVIVLSPLLDQNQSNSPNLNNDTNPTTRNT
jgi:hypothetical protein